VSIAYKLHHPCAKCPFRTDIPPFLNRARAREIVNALVRSEFPCHATLDYSECETSEDEARDTAHTQHCAGALIMLEHDNKPSQMMRICERFGSYDRRKLKMDAPVFKSTRAFINAQEKR
jgi:hypothetical protein